MNRLNLLLLVVALNVALVALGAHAGLGDMFKKKDKSGTTPAPELEDSAGEPEAPAPAKITAAGARSRLKASIHDVREAKAEQDRLAAEAAAAAAAAQANAPQYPKRRGPGGDNGSRAARNRRRHNQPEEPDQREEGNHEDDYEQAIAAYRKKQGESVEDAEVPPEGADDDDPNSSQDVRGQLAARYVSTYKDGAKRSGLIAPKITTVRRLRQSDSDSKKSNYWGKQFGKALQVTKEGIKKSANAIAELPKYVGEAADWASRLAKLDGRGKLLALIEEVKGDIHFVRKEFSQFTLNWSPEMEKALNYLGDKHLDKIKWNDRDELDLRKDALHVIVFGYEFMRLMVAWRENLLIAHEAYKLWLESLKGQYEKEHFDVDENLLIQLSTIQSYLLLSAWEEIDERTYENRFKLDHLMDVEDDRPKNYESEYFRGIIVLQEMYIPTAEELDEEREQVQESIRTSGVVVDKLEEVTDFYDQFRKSVETDEMTDVDCKLPKELHQFLDKLKPQVESSPLVFTKGFLKDLRQARAERQAEQAGVDEPEPPAAKPKKGLKALFGSD